MLAKEYCKQISDITSTLIGLNLSESQNYPSYNSKSGALYISGRDLNLSISLKNMPYKDIYQIIDKEFNYNVKFIDGGIVQLSYQFDPACGDLLKHRLTYFASPFFETLQNNQEIYERDELYGDVLKKNILPIPVRFDYDPRANEGKKKEEYEGIHPNSHVTFGQYEHCRIAVSNHLSPMMFFEFILKSFYGRMYYSNIFRNEKIIPKHKVVKRCIEDSEKTALHMSIAF